MVLIPLVGPLSWSVLVVRVTLWQRFRPVPVGIRSTTSVVAPRHRAAPDMIESCLKS